MNEPSSLAVASATTLLVPMTQLWLGPEAASTSMSAPSAPPYTTQKAFDRKKPVAKSG